ncbi:MAG: hypothetical protein HRU05_14370 [Oceanospirillaceae bacterium]|nr:hypothetical protein [Oceanospirillaceae bacterium]
MARTISSDDKFDLQQNFRRFIKFHDLFQQHNEQFKSAKASRVWIAAVVAIVFAMGSSFFMGVAAGLFGLYFYRVISANMQKSSAEEGRESAERWFAAKSLKFEGRVLYHFEDNMLETPLDPFDDSIYG